MLRFITSFLFILSMLSVVSQNITLNCGENQYKDNSYPNITDSIVNMIPLKKGIVSRKSLKTFNNKNYKEVTVTVPGTLSDIIGSNINDIDSIVIKGTINDIDFNTLWSASFNGRLSVINLEGASI